MTPRLSRPDVRYAVLVAVALAGLAAAVHLLRGDVGLGRAVLTDLLRGRQGVQRHIDWEHLKAMGVEVGATYTGLPNDKERAAYRKNFVTGVALSFQQTGARVKDFVGWRMQGRAGGRLVVAADYPAKQQTLLLEFADAAWRKKLTAIQWLTPGAPQ